MTDTQQNSAHPTLESCPLPTPLPAWRQALDYKDASGRTFEELCGLIEAQGEAGSVLRDALERWYGWHAGHKHTVLHAPSPADLTAFLDGTRRQLQFGQSLQFTGGTQLHGGVTLINTGDRILATSNT